ncbi:MAG: N-acetylmuramoyl-L-alanine amidase, partial [uncultured Pseudonocardia sp.]
EPPPATVRVGGDVGAARPRAGGVLVRTRGRGGRPGPRAGRRRSAVPADPGPPPRGRARPGAQRRQRREPGPDRPPRARRAGRGEGVQHHRHRDGRR